MGRGALRRRRRRPLRFAPARSARPCRPRPNLSPRSGPQRRTRQALSPALRDRRAAFGGLAVNRGARRGERGMIVERMAKDVRDIDVLIIGAGINGAGLFRDLCEQGLTVAIVDKADFGSGTSAAPSRLIHGGIKYLETGE